MEHCHFFFVGSCFGRHVPRLRHFECQYALMAAVAYGVGYVSVGGPDGGALCRLKELLPMLRLGMFYRITVSIACLCALYESGGQPVL